MTPAEWTPDAIRQLRRSRGERVAVFGARFGRSGRTVEDWEQGRRRPDVLVRRLLDQMAARKARTR